MDQHQPISIRLARRLFHSVATWVVMVAVLAACSGADEAAQSSAISAQNQMVTLDGGVETPLARALPADLPSVEGSALSPTIVCTECLRSRAPVPALRPIDGI